MVQIPQYAQQVGIDAPSRDVPNVEQANDGGIGQGIANLGGALMDVQQAVQERARKKAELSTALSRQVMLEDLDQGLEEKKRNAPADGTGLHDDYMTTVFRPRVAKYLEGITDPRLREEKAAEAETLLADVYSHRSGNAEYEISNKHSHTAFDALQQKNLEGVAANPAEHAAYLQDTLTTIDNLPDVSDAEKDELRIKARQAVPDAVGEALKVQDPEAYRFVAGTRNAGDTNSALPSEVDRIDLLASRLSPSLPGVDPSKVRGAIAKHKGDVGAALGDLAVELGLKEADRPHFVERGLASLGPARVIAGPADGQGPATAAVSAAQLIAHFEGFRDQAYWDVDHHRVGYGSDTATRDDGTIEAVSPGTTVSRQEAGRDLSRRINDAQARIASQIGDPWGGLPDGAKAALTSVAYNYGSLPKRVLAAARTGDTQAISLSILGLSGDNGGVNARRRAEEAAIAAGGSAPSGVAFVPSFLADMPAADFQRLQVSVSDASSVMADRKRVAQELLKVQTSNQMDNDIATIQQTGKSAIQGNDVTQLEAQIVSAHGLDKLASYRADRAVAQRVFDLTQDAGRLPDETLQARIESLKPRGGEDAALQQRVYDQVKTKIAAIQKEREQDPALAAQRNFPEVQKAWAAYNPQNPDSARKAIEATVAAQRVTGVPGDQVQPFIDEAATKVVDVVKDETRPIDERIGTLVQNIGVTPDPAQQEQIVRQLVRSGLSPQIANVIEAWKRNDTGATRRLFQAAMLDQGKVPKLGSGESKLGAAVEEAILGAGAPGRVFYGLDYGDPHAGEMAASDLDLAKSAARIAMASGMDQDSAVSQAVSDIFGPVEVIDDELPSGGQVRGLVGAETDRDALLRGMSNARGTLVDILQGYQARKLGALGVGVSPQQRRVYEATLINDMNRILADGIWRNSGHGWSFYDPVNRSFVADDAGKVIVFANEDLLQMAGSKKETVGYPGKGGAHAAPGVR